MKSIELAPDQRVIYDRLMNLIESIEKRLRFEIEPSESDQIAFEINHRQQMAADSGIILEYATAIFNHVQGVVAAQIMADEDIMKCPAAIRTMIIKGRLAKWDGIYERAIEATKTLDKSISGLVSLLSYNKQLINSNIGSQNRKEA